MRFPFFNNPKQGSKAITHTAITVRPASNHADTQLIHRLASKPATQPSHEPGVGTCVSLSAVSLLPQLPQQLLTDEGHTQLASVTLSIPVSLVLPQLSSGRVSVKIAELVPLLPAHLLRSPLPPVSDQQCVVLPLQEVIAGIPSELLAVEHESVIAADDPELDQLPNLIDDSLINPAPAPEPEPVTPNEPKEPPARPTSSLVVPPRPRTSDAPEYVMVSLRSLVAVMPEAVFCCPRTQLAGKVNLDTPVLLPTDPIVPQLRSAAVKLPLSIIIAMVPHQVLANPMPALDGQMIPIPLNEIIPQLPKTLFTDHLREPCEESAIDNAEIPDPFHEKSAIVETPAEAPVAVDLTVDEAALEDNSFSIFAERTPALPIEPVASEPTPEPVVVPETEIAEPLPEPVATVEPVAEPEPAVEEVVAVEPEPEPVEVVTPEAVQPVVEPEPVMAAAEEAVPPVVEPEPEVVAPVAEVALPAAEPVSEPAAETPAVDERKLLVDLNRCGVEDLVTIPGIGRALAQRIVDFRNTRGQFHSVHELRQVPGIGRKTFRALAGVQPRALNRLLGAPHDGELTLQEIVRLAGKLPGIEGCMLATSDGLFLTGELPAHLDQSTISVFAPQLFKKVGRYARELKVGSIRRFTIFTDTQPISIFRAGDVYLIVIHDPFRFSKALLRRCERISQEIARLSSQRVTV